MENGSIQPALDPITGAYISIEEQLERFADSKFHKFKKTLGDPFTDTCKNHVKKIVGPCVVKDRSHEWVLHAEYQQNFLQIYDTHTMKVVRRITLPYEQSYREKHKVLAIQFHNFRYRSQVFGPVGTTGVLAVLSSNQQLNVYTKNAEELRFYLTVNLKEPASRMWHMEMHNAWLASFRNKIFQFVLKQGEEPIKAEVEIPQTMEIMDICEISAPLRICIATLEKLIVMYDWERKQHIRVLSGHTTAVRKLLNIDIAGGYLLSLGYEPFVRVW